jgi:co-chaperonin GroES (HSP10)
MPQTREAIKHAPVSKEVWRNNRTQVGGLWFDPLKITPLTDHILLVLDSESQCGIPDCPCNDGDTCNYLATKDTPAMTPPRGTIIKPDVARNQEIGTRIGTVVSVGPGKWHEKRKSDLSWVLNPLLFKPTTLKPGDRVAIGHYSDWESWFCDYEGRGRNVVLCQEADVRVVFGQSSRHSDRQILEA